MSEGSPMRTREQIIRDWDLVINTVGIRASNDPVLSTEEAHAALAASYEVRTNEVRQWTEGQAYWELISQDERDKAADSGAAMPDGSYPITTCDGDNSVDTAISAVGRGGADHDGIRRHIIKRADSLGCASKIPDNWNSDGSLKAGATADAMATPPPPPARTEPAEPVAQGDSAAEDADETADATVTAKIDSALTAVQDAIKAQTPDADSPQDAKVMTGLQHAEAMLKQAQSDQEADSTGDPDSPHAPEGDDGAPAKAPAGSEPAAPQGPPAAAAATGASFAPTPPPPPAGGKEGNTPGNAGGVPGDGDDSPPHRGDVEPTTACENPNCKHLASAHEDLADGKNTGACTMAGCTCPGMVLSGQQVNGPSDPSGGVPQDTGSGHQGAAHGGNPRGTAEAGTAEGTSFAPPPPPGATDDQAPPVTGAPAPALPPLDPMPDVVGPSFTMPVAWLEDTETGDGRQIAPGALTWRTPPLPLMGLKTSPHDPSGFSPNDPAVLVGRIETITRDGNKGVMGGHLLSTPEGQEFALILEQMGRMGVSIDVGAVETTVGITAPMPGPGPGPDVFDIPLIETLTKGEVMGATICPFAAFAGAYIVLGDADDQAAMAELPEAPEDAHMAIRYVGADVCEPCETDRALVAAGAPVASTGGPLAPPRAWFDDPGFHVGDERLRETIDSKNGRPSGKFACPLTVTADGRVFGHIAQWGVCHQSPKFVNAGQCVLAPRSKTDYALFHRGHVLTAEGELLSVGAITADAGHAGEEWTVSRALAHYDNTALTAAVVRAGEDDFGIWVAGSVHPSASPEQVFTLRANPPSGDWRPYGAGNELRAVLAVNVPGFPHVAATTHNGRVTSLVAAGVPMFEMPEETRTPPTLEERLAMLEAGMAPVLPLAKAELSRRMEAVRAG